MQPIYTCKQLGVSLKITILLLLKFFIIGASFFMPLFFLIKGFLLDTYLKLIVVASLASAVYIVINMKFIFNDRIVSYVSGILPDEAKLFLIKI